MPDILAARSQMGTSLAFHIVFASVGVAMPLLMVIAGWLHLKTGDDVYYTPANQGHKQRSLLSLGWRR
jgi:cytochrome d ubiquinol oxidase subunit I